MAYQRDYKREARMESSARRTRRNYITRMRRKLIREGRLKVGDSKQVDHVRQSAFGGKNVNTSDNLRIVDAHANMRRQAKRKGPNKGYIKPENRINGK